MRRLEWIQRLIRLVEESEIDTVEISRLATRVRVSKSPPIVVGGGGGGNRSATLVATGSAASSAGEVAPPMESPGGESGPDDLHVVSSPMVGTFYRSPAPDAPAYVEVGDRVTKGQTLCILEAMKLMNELESEVAGTIREIAVQNAEPVEYGQTLFRIDPDGAD